MQFEHNGMNNMKIKIPDMTLISSMKESEKLEKKYRTSLKRMFISAGIAIYTFSTVAVWDIASIAFVIPLISSLFAGAATIQSAKLVEPVESQREVLKELKPAIEALKTPYVSKDGSHIIFGYDCLDINLSSKQALVLNIPADYHLAVERMTVSHAHHEAVEHYVNTEQLSDAEILDDIKRNQWILGEVSNPARDVLNSFYQNKLSNTETPYYKSMEKQVKNIENHRYKSLKAINDEAAKQDFITGPKYTAKPSEIPNIESTEKNE